jgi:hypothetical protein
MGQQRERRLLRPDRCRTKAQSSTHREQSK